jgi:hypothetical protein
MASRSGQKAQPRHNLTRLPQATHRGGNTGSATVFLFGSSVLPRFRWVTSRRGRASCTRHYGAGRLCDPTACKVTQHCCDADSPEPKRATYQQLYIRRRHRESR